MKRLLTAVALLASCSAHAIEYTQVQAERSAIGFTYQQMGVKVDGHFRKFAVQLAFDPAKPAAARVAVDIDLASVDAGSSDADQEVGGKQWFATKSFPVAKFVSTAVKPAGANRFELAGKLTLKGQTRDVLVPATLAAQGAAGVFEGTLTLHRGDFAVGEGPWAKFDIVANDVVVKFRIAAAASK